VNRRKKSHTHIAKTIPNTTGIGKAENRNADPCFKFLIKQGRLPLRFSEGAQARGERDWQTSLTIIEFAADGVGKAKHEKALAFIKPFAVGCIEAEGQIKQPYSLEQIQVSSANSVARDASRRPRNGKHSKQKKSVLFRFFMNQSDRPNLFY
jgi:hypothetical protein